MHWSYLDRVFNGFTSGRSRFEILDIGAGLCWVALRRLEGGELLEEGEAPLASWAHVAGHEAEAAQNAFAQLSEQRRSAWLRLCGGDVVAVARLNAFCTDEGLALYERCSRRPRDAMNPSKWAACAAFSWHFARQRSSRSLANLGCFRGS